MITVGEDYEVWGRKARVIDGPCMVAGIRHWRVRFAVDDSETLVPRASMRPWAVASAARKAARRGQEERRARREQVQARLAFIKQTLEERGISCHTQMVASRGPRGPRGRVQLDLDAQQLDILCELLLGDESAAVPEALDELLKGERP